MWWSRPLPVLAVLVALLTLGPAGCGFHPLYGRGQAAKDGTLGAEMAAIRVEMIEDRVGQKLRNELISRLNPRGEPVAAKYTLTVKVSESTSGLAHSSDGTATLAELNLGAGFTLIMGDKRGGGTSGSAQAVVGTDFLGPRYASVSIERDAEDRAIIQVANQIVGQIAVFLNNPASRPPPDSGPPPTASIQHYQVLQGLPSQSVPEAPLPAQSVPVAPPPAQSVPVAPSPARGGP